jgi:osmoprotectant transport system permease protein
MKRLLPILLLLATVIPAHGQSTIAIGSKRFAESEILGEIVTKIINNTGETKAVHKAGLGNTGIVFAALKHGDIELYPEYTGSIALELLKDNTTPDLGTLDQQLTPLGLAVGVPIGFDDTYAIAVPEALAERDHLETIGDLARYPALRLGLSQEFLNRADGWPGLKKAYGLPFVSPQGIDHGLAYESIGSGQVDAIDIYSTDSKINRYHLRVLKDDKNYFPQYSAVLLYRLEFPRKYPRSWQALQILQDRIPVDQMIRLNGQVELDHLSYQDVAADYVQSHLNIGSGSGRAPGSGSFLALLFGGDFWELTGQHLFLVLVSLALSVGVGVPLGIFAARRRRLAQPILSTVGIIQTIPSLALLAFLIPVLSIGDKPAIAALFLYSLLPIVRNTYTGIVEIAPSLIESGIALGLPSSARLRLIELPLASRTIFAGIKTAAVINVGTATIAAFIGAGGYGERIKAGLDTLDNRLILAGAIPAALLAIVVQIVFDALDRAMTPKGLR